ncbi:hypothetical protein KQ51_01089 [Candidatus Izimaplasma bacterium HR1]|jgi:hypothetical protein|uniref:hypothetical protein n=1 Tax=Candidatus Izimoplasma sp. HR1 TaxID=1541959 RepID=UPI0004F75C96|nr:hypothetical protein KQ51_01089 [Candidatus Izimaplasma bacterium HR1]
MKKYIIEVFLDVWNKNKKKLLAYLWSIVSYLGTIFDDLLKSIPEVAFEISLALSLVVSFFVTINIAFNFSKKIINQNTKLEVKIQNHETTIELINNQINAINYNEYKMIGNNEKPKLSFDLVRYYANLHPQAMLSQEPIIVIEDKIPLTARKNYITLNKTKVKYSTNPINEISKYLQDYEVVRDEKSAVLKEKSKHLSIFKIVNVGNVALDAFYPLIVTNDIDVVSSNIVPQLMKVNEEVYFYLLIDIKDSPTIKYDFVLNYFYEDEQYSQSFFLDIKEGKLEQSVKLKRDKE